MLLNTQPGRASRTLRQLGARPGEDTDASSFTIPGLNDCGKSPDAVADEIAEYFSAISNEFEPVNLQDLPDTVRYDIVNYLKESVPVITVETVEKLLRDTKPSNRGTKGTYRRCYSRKPSK